MSEKQGVLKQGQTAATIKPYYYFREWVIGQGKDFCYKTINDPETLVDVDTKEIG